MLWVKLDFKDGFELVDDFCEEGWEIISEIVFGGGWIGVIALL